jgi:hypothetical protein
MREGAVTDQKDDDIAARLQARAEQVTPLERDRTVLGGSGETAWVRKLFDQINAFVLKGMTFHEIAAVLNEEGVQLQRDKIWTGPRLTVVFSRERLRRGGKKRWTRKKSGEARSMNLAPPVPAGAENRHMARASEEATTTSAAPRDKTSLLAPWEKPPARIGLRLPPGGLDKPDTMTPIAATVEPPSSGQLGQKDSPGKRGGIDLRPPWKVRGQVGIVPKE